MSIRPTDDPRIRRRTVLRAAGAGVAGLLAGTASAQAGYRLVQASDCTPLSPLSGDVPAEEFYRYDEGRTYWSASGPVDALTAPETSRLFLYDGPDGLSLVFVHGARQENDPVGGGAASFEIRGLPSDGEWVVRDDFYEGPTRFDRWSFSADRAVIHWTWGAGRTDGAVFRGVDGARVVVDPAFNSDAELYGQHYSGDVQRWQAVTGSLDDPETVGLDGGQRVIIEPGDC